MAQEIDLVAIAAEAGGRYAPEAYAFVGEGLRHAAQRLGREGKTGDDRHLRADELVQGVLELAAQRYGLLGRLLLRSWGLHRSEDIGAITFQLIEHGVFGKQPSDSQSDFADGPAFGHEIERLVRVRLAG